MELPQSDHELVYRSRQEFERLSKAGSAEAPEACLRQGLRHPGCSCCPSSRACSLKSLYLSCLVHLLHGWLIAVASTWFERLQLAPRAVVAPG